ncbi:MAG: PKD domain-containing protein, partial [Candidatus Thermoplasmatota archaeon]|nr:PKD domain-containing protein [Candidatus Thermoplasmatota archaeon]
LASDGEPGDWFGGSVSLLDGTAIIGAPHDNDNGGSSGSAYVFTRTNTTWVQQQKLLASDGESGDLFGISVSLDSGTVLIGAVWDDDKGVDSGSAYIFTKASYIWVDDDYNSSTPGWGYDHFNIIQDGINAVAENGTVFVYNGTYYEWVNITKTIKLHGENREETIIDATGLFYGLETKSNVIDIIITNLTVKNSASCGVFVGSSDIIFDNVTSCDNINDYGFYVKLFSNITIKNCLAYNNEEGIYDDGSNNLNVYGCTFRDNWKYGLRLGQRPTTNAYIHHNNFISNDIDNAYDDGDGSNLWDYNFYDDYSGIDANGDGIGDTPYTISGSAGEQDLYPLMTSYGPPYAHFTYTITDKTVFFNATSSYDYNGLITNYTWDFGDQTTAYGLTSTHTYASYQDYTVTLTVTDDVGNTDTCTQTITITDLLPPTVSDIYAYPNPQHLNEPVTIKSTIIDNVAVSTVSVIITAPDTSTTNQTMTYNPLTCLAYYNTTYAQLGTYSYVIWANDTNGNSNTSPPHTFDIINDHPFIPSNPQPANGSTNIDTTVTLSWTGGDPNANDTVTYDVYFGTTSPPPQIVANLSGTSYEVSTLSYDTVYYWRIVAWDNHNASTSGPLWHFTTKHLNIPPPAPHISGPTWGIINNPYTFSLGAITDPDGDQLYCLWDWGDGTTSGWLGPYASGTTVTATHTWSEKGTYGIRVKLKDQYGSESTWSEPHAITIYELKKAFLFGRYTNMTTSGDYTTMQAVNIRLLHCNPFQFLHYVSGETIIYAEGSIIIMFPKLHFLIGFVNALL